MKDVKSSRILDSAESDRIHGFGTKIAFME